MCFQPPETATRDPTEFLRKVIGEMAKRKTGYCPVCDKNIVHSRFFENRLAWRIDRITLGFLAAFDVGPWRCVDCGNRQMFVQPRRDGKPIVSEAGGSANDKSGPVGNFIRTRESLVHSVVDSDRFSEKYRAGVVRKILEAKVPISRICSELAVTELEVQRWIRSWLEAELNRMAESARSSELIVPGEVTGDDSHHGEDTPRPARVGNARIVESTVVPRTR